MHIVFGESVFDVAFVRRTDCLSTRHAHPVELVYIPRTGEWFSRCSFVPAFLLFSRRESACFFFTSEVSRSRSLDRFKSQILVPRMHILYIFCFVT